MPDSLPDFRDIQVWEYLDFFARGFGLRGKARTRTLAEIEEFTNLGGIRCKYLSALSKGMKQRVSLARSLIHNPGVLIMDEPAAGLDPRARLELRSLLRVLSGQGKAILLSSHILSELQDICDGAIIIEKGKLLSAGTLTQLMAKASGVAAGTADAAPAVTLVIQCAKTEEARLKLLEHPAVKEVAIRGEGELQAFLAGGDEVVPPVMATLFAAGLPVMGFARKSMGLEELFMSAATGGRERLLPDGLWQELPSRPRRFDLTPWIVLGAILLLLLEVAERRIGIVSALFRRAPRIALPKAKKEKTKKRQTRRKSRSVEEFHAPEIVLPLEEPESGADSGSLGEAFRRARRR